jgi:hypothetical protein
MKALPSEFPMVRGVTSPFAYPMEPIRLPESETISFIEITVKISDAMVNIKKGIKTRLLGPASGILEVFAINPV